MVISSRCPTVLTNLIYIVAATIAFQSINHVDAFTSSPQNKLISLPTLNLKVTSEKLQFNPIIKNSNKKSFYPGTLPQYQPYSSSLQAKTNSSPDKKESSSLTPVLSTVYLIILDVALRKAFKKAAISFPSSLAGCGALFATLLAANQINAELGDNLYNILSPGAGVLAKWLPVFFVPSLVTLPLAPSMGSALELAKIALVIVGGFYFTLLTTSWLVIGARKIGGGGGGVEKYPALTPNDAPNKPKPKAFSDATFATLTTSTLVTAVLATLASRATGISSTVVTSLKSLFMISTTLASFVFGARLPSKFTKIIHPLVTCTSMTWIGAKLLSILAGGSFISVLQSYKTGSLSPLYATGAGDILLFMLGPAVVALACQMYDRKSLMRQNIKEVGTAVVGSSIGGLFGTALLVRVLKVANPVLRLSTLSRNITSPLAMAIASLLQADVSLAVSMVVISGLIGANFGAMILDSFGIKDPVARGLGVGAASHGLGTAAFANEKDAFPFAAIAMALTASFSTVMVSIPAVRKTLVNIALGGM